MTAAYALGCPSCPYWVEVSEEDPDCSLSELHNHLFHKHAGYERKAALALLAKVVELTESQAVTRA